jgi:hypothetical protein
VKVVVQSETSRIAERVSAVGRVQPRTGGFGSRKTGRLHVEDSRNSELEGAEGGRSDNGESLKASYFSNH